MSRKCTLVSPPSCTTAGGPSAPTSHAFLVSSNPQQHLLFSHPFPFFADLVGWVVTNFHFFDYSSYTLLIIWASPSVNFFISLAHFSVVSSFSYLFKQIFYILFYLVFLYFLNINLLLVFNIEVSSPRVNPSVILPIYYFV